ncbi:MAG: HipA domain-containing protein [Schwartzia sp.]|nr:HipA domain-containing protein [Schwartzia sp. (in: firmicutes)]
MRTVTEYTLRSKDIALADFSIETEDIIRDGKSEKQETIHIDHVNDDKWMLLPIPLAREVTGKSLASWLMSRRVPTSRQHADALLQSINAAGSTTRFISATLALSLNDSYWIEPRHANIKWDEVSLYDPANRFDMRLAQTAFTGEMKKIYSGGRVTSPEYTTDGTLKKFWRRDDGTGQIELIKGDDFFFGVVDRSQAVNEFFASEVAESMGLDYVTYSLDTVTTPAKSDVVCVCPLFTSEKTGFVTAHDFFAEQGIDTARDLSSRDAQKEMAKSFGEEAYGDMMIFDAVIGNRDRHLKNFGYLRDNDTGEYLRPAPIFDSGLSLLYGASGKCRADMAAYSETVHGQHIKSLREYASYFLSVRHYEKLLALTRFEFREHPIIKTSDSLITAMNEFIRVRAKKLIEHATSE